MSSEYNQYKKLIEKVFFEHYGEGTIEFEFSYESIEKAAHELGISKNQDFEDMLHSFGYQRGFPDRDRTRKTGIVPQRHLATIDIFDVMLGSVRGNMLDDEQALLAVVRYNRLIDTFLGLTTYSLQNHLRTTVRGVGQIEIDELYVGLDKRGCHYVIPVQAKGGADRIGIVQTEQDIRFVEQKYPGMRCRAVAAQFLPENAVALFELAVQDDEVRVVEERHYRLVPADRLDPESIRDYRS